MNKQQKMNTVHNSKCKQEFIVSCQQQLQTNNDTQTQCYSCVVQYQSNLHVYFQAFPLCSLQRWKAFLILAQVLKLLPSHNLNHIHFCSLSSNLPLARSVSSTFIQYVCGLCARPTNFQTAFFNYRLPHL